MLKQPPPLIEVTGMAEAWVEIASRPWVARRRLRNGQGRPAPLRTPAGSRSQGRAAAPAGRVGDTA
ncbi:MAG: hypothetical protein WDM92_12035 [Caulobacteraceae bacterium]